MHSLRVRWLATTSLALSLGSLGLAGCGSDDGDLGEPHLSGSDIENKGPENNHATAACPEGKVSVDASALKFDGESGFVTMGVAPDLGLANFTIEAWVRREGRGVTMGTGVGGLTMVPIAGKGRGESDGSNVDCNYAMGFAGDVLGADFEDMATGANHPVLGRTKIPYGEWHHVAAAYDGARWQLFVDGKLDGEATANATPRQDSIQHFGIATALNSMGVPAGFLKGSVDEVRVWNRARTESEIASGMYRRVGQEPGLVGRWALDAKDGGIPDSAGNNAGTLRGGASFAVTGAVLDLGVPPRFTEALPAFNAELTGDTATLSVAIDDPDSDEFTATFHVRPIAEEDDFSIVVLPDTQYYTRPQDNPKYFNDQTKWVMDNAGPEAYNIKAVIHNGDIVDRAGVTSQWVVADRAMKNLEAKSSALPEGMPFGTCAGNHDLLPFGETGGTTEYNRYFGPQRFAGRSYFGGTHLANKNDENWFTFSAGGLDFVVVNFQFGSVARERAALDWGRSIFQQHPEAFGIANSHYILTGAGNFSPAGRSIYDALKDQENVKILTSGHVSAEQRRADTSPESGHTIVSMLADYQSRSDANGNNGGMGILRIWEFSPKNDEITVRTFSTSTKQFEEDDDSQFTLKMDLAGSGGAFREHAVVDPATATDVRATLEGLAPGQTYEWFVTVTDCAHTVSSPIYRFKTK